MKPRTATKQPQRSMQVGRKVMQPKHLTSQATARAKTERRLQAADEQRAIAAANAQREREQADAEQARACRDLAMMRAGALGLDGIETRKLANTVENKRRTCIQAGKLFDPYAAIRDELARLGHAVQVSSGASPLDAQLRLPLPPQEGTKPVQGTEQRAAAAERARLDADRAKRLAEQNQRDRDAYHEALKRHGLQPPDVGYPSGSGGTSGFGY